MTSLPPTFQTRRHKITVIAAPDSQGQVHPLLFTWRGRLFEIESWGRRWQAADGEHFLVMTAAGRMFELVHRPSDDQWFLINAAPRHATV